MLDCTHFIGRCDLTAVYLPDGVSYRIVFLRYFVCYWLFNITLLLVCRLAFFTYALMSAFRFAMVSWRWSFYWTSLR